MNQSTPVIANDAHATERQALARMRDYWKRCEPAYAMLNERWVTELHRVTMFALILPAHRTMNTFVELEKTAEREATPQSWRTLLDAIDLAHSQLDDAFAGFTQLHSRGNC